MAVLVLQGGGALGAYQATVGAVNVRTGRMRYFDSCSEPLDRRHVTGSGTLPPAVAAVHVDDNPKRNSLVFAVQLRQGAGDAPQTTWQVNRRQKDIPSPSRVDSHVQRRAQIHQWRHIVRELTPHLPAGAMAKPDLCEMADYGCGTVMHLKRPWLAPVAPMDGLVVHDLEA